MSFFSSSSTSTTDAKSPEAGATATTGSSPVVSALASTPSSGGGGDHENDGDNTPHYHFIHSMILPSTTKIQKEMRGWKFKEVQAKLTEAVNLLEKFQHEKWPDTDKESAKAVAAAGKEAEDGDTEQSGTYQNATTTTTSTLSGEDGMIEDDPLTRETMPESVTTALEAYVLTMQHPQKTTKACENALECVTQLSIRGYVSGRAGGRDDDTASGSAALRERDPDAAAGSGNSDASLMHRLLQSIQTCSESNAESVQSHVVECIKSIMISPKCGIHEASMLLGIRSVFHIYLVTKSATTRQSSRAALMDIIANMLSRTETSPLKENSLWYTDSYYLLRSLVKLSSKPLPGLDDKSNSSSFLSQSFFASSAAVDPLALNNKILSLELILHSMECAGRNVCNGEKVIHLVQSQLCVALLKNCMSNSTQVAFVSQQIFLVLMWKFKTHLKDEIQVFMSNIFLRVLDSDNSSFEQKALVLESLRSMCKDPVLLTQIFLNYDCDFDAMNLYKDIVFHLTKLSGKATAQSTSNMSKKAAEEHYELSLAANEVLVSILQAFLAALGMQASNEATNDTAGKKIRKALNIHEVVTPRRSMRKSSLLAGDLERKSAIGEDLEHVAMITAEELKKRISGTNGAGSASKSNGDPLDQYARSEVAGKIVDAFDRKRNAEQNFEIGSVKFTLDLKGGLNFFIDNGFVECDAKEIAVFFLKNKDKLDKTQMGEVLGREPDSAFIKKPPDLDAEKGGSGFFIRVLHHYIHAMDFTGMVFDEAIRLFLSGFRLPGEAQKIDRIMEKFAERFTNQNPDIFPSADTAFILAFSVIMLNTDLHNPSIKEERRMTLDSFLRNNRGIGENGSDLPAEFLGGIFERIKASPFSLKEDDAAREKATETVEVQLLGDNGGLLGAGLFGTSTEERKKEKFKKEREEMMAATEKLIRRRKVRASKSESMTDSIPPSDVVKPMFDVTWGPMIGILSQVIECSNDERSIAVCLNGFVYAIRISAHNDMSLARDTFVNSLAKFTYLGSIKEMKYKNIESIRTLMNIAITDGEYLGESWGPVLQCISQLARMRMSASGLDSDGEFLQDSKKAKEAAKKKESTSKSYFTTTKSDGSKEADDMNSQAILESISEQLIDQVFSSSVKLSGESLCHFIEQLVAVSDAEIEGDLKGGITGVASSISGSGHGGDDGPRIFSMQRLVEVADYNMDVRPRLVWTQIWEIMSAFFARNGCHRNAMVSVFAIDALKQLGLKFLEKGELAEFHFQRLFLRPFLLVTQNPETRQDIRELILACIDQMISTRAKNLQSGWKIFFDVLTLSARNPNAKISIHALNILQRTLDEHLDDLTLFTRNDTEDGQSKEDDDISTHDRRVRNANAEDFLDLCRTSLAFIDVKDTENPRPVGVFMRALCHIAIFADLIAAKKVLYPISGAQYSDPQGPGYTYEGLDEQEALEMVLWRTLLEGLANVISATERSRSGGVGNLVQRGSVLALRAIMLRHGSLFSNKQLGVVLEQTILPAIQSAVENDGTPVTSIASESPAVSSLDFLAEPLPVPPAVDDVGLLKFEEVVRSGERTPSRSMGPAELLLEATFMDLRHGGGGDLTKAHRFAKKLDMESSEHEEQPFPDSWISTTAPVALGTLTDISTEILIPRSSTGIDFWRSTIGKTYEHWCNGRFTCLSGSEENIVTVEWIPCEAVMRIACSEISRFMSQLSSLLSKLDPVCARLWANESVKFFSEVMAGSLALEQEIMDRILQEKWKAYAASSNKDVSADNMIIETSSKEEEQTAATNHDESIDDTDIVESSDEHEPTQERNTDEAASDTDLNSPSLEDGQPEIKNVDEGEDSTGEPAHIIRLDFQELHHPIPTANEISVDQFAKLDGKVDTSESSVWMKLLPALKIRCIAGHHLQQGLLALQEDELTARVDRDAIALLLKTLNLSRELAEGGVKNKDLAHAFQEVMFNDFLVDEGEEALLNIAHLNDTQGSAMFFLTQTAGATNAVIRMLNALYDYEEAFEGSDTWDRRSYASQYLMEIMEDIFFKFAESEAKEGHRIDPNVWRNTSDSGVKVAVYCTSFASVVVGLLKAMLSFDPSHIERNKAVFFPMICELVCVQSEEIRRLVRQILVEKFSPMLGITVLTEHESLRSSNMRGSVRSNDSPIR
mmetsp:Transcript_59953/g.147342  ORF Transcript_59953/g.147342 Transcript_59953/m.147342 type:complete len:2142 (-) Transcript_59953:113-6538(-)